MTSLTGTGRLVRLILRRDRLLLPLWILFVGLIPLSYASSLAAVFPTAVERQQYGDNAGFVALYGRLSGTSLGELVAWRAGFLPVIVGLIGLLTVIRHTRTEEETGRRELLGATVVGRHAGLAAALAATFGANLVLAAVVALGMLGKHLPATGSVALGAELAAAGWVFAAVGAVAAQLTTGAGGARGIAVGVLGAAYLLRVVGDLSGQAGGGLSWLSWLSPIGLVHRIHPYGGDHWWLLALAAGLTAVLAAAAVALSARRDVGAGLLPPRPGPATAAPGLRSPLALAWRLHRGLLAGWAAGFAALGVVLGGLANGIGNMGHDNPTLQDIFARMGGRAGLIDAYLAGIMGVLGLIAAAYAIQATLRLRAEEAEQRAEPVLATSASRVGWAGSHLLVAAGGAAVVLAAGGAAAGLAHGLRSGDVAGQLGRVLGAALVQLPAVWVMAAIGATLFGLAPRLVVGATWAILAVVLVIAVFGEPLRFDQRVQDLSPFAHLPRLPAADFVAAPLVWPLAAATVLAVAGLAAFRRRDLASGA